MQRRSFLRRALCGCVGLLTFTDWAPSREPAWVRDATIPPIPDRVALASMVILGKVSTIEEKQVSALPFLHAKETVPHEVGVIQVENVLNGAKGITHVRVGFPHANIKEARVPVGTEGYFFLKRHFTENFFVLAAPAARCGIIPKNAMIDKNLAQIKQCARLLADPDVSLKSQEAAERLLIADMLVTRYRLQEFLKPKIEPIAAEQSRLILLALAEADWTKAPIHTRHPLRTFNRLGLGEKDGWKEWKDLEKVSQQQLSDQARQWLKANAGTYRIHRFIEGS